MKHIAQMLTVAALAFAVATPALASKATLTKEQRAEMHMKQINCKKEASEQKFGVHMVKKHAFVKECMKRA